MSLSPKTIRAELAKRGSYNWCISKHTVTQRLSLHSAFAARHSLIRD